MDKIKDGAKDIGKQISSGTKTVVNDIKSGYNKAADYIKDDKKPSNQSSSN